MVPEWHESATKTTSMPLASAAFSQALISSSTMRSRDPGPLLV
jgi:hypothetical protein